jgi:hypothetical protein
MDERMRLLNWLLLRRLDGSRSSVSEDCAEIKFIGPSPIELHVLNGWNYPSLEARDNDIPSPKELQTISTR